MSKIKPDDIVVQRQDLVAIDSGDQIVALSVESGSYFSMDETARTIWALLENPIAVGELVDSLIEQFKVDPDLCLKETLEFLEELHTEGLVTIQTAPELEAQD